MYYFLFVLQIVSQPLLLFLEHTPYQEVTKALTSRKKHMPMYVCAYRWMTNMQLGKGKTVNTRFSTAPLAKYLN